MNLKMDETHAVKYIKGARHILPHGAGNGKRGLQEARFTDKLCHYITWKRRYFRKAGGFPKWTRAAHRTACFRVAARLPHRTDFLKDEACGSQNGFREQANSYRPNCGCARRAECPWNARSAAP